MNPTATGIPSADFWRDRTVFVTGHTGFKGAWLCTWLLRLGARVHGLSLAPTDEQPLFDVFGLAERLESSVFADLREPAPIGGALRTSGADVVLHLAAQPLVRESYRTPIETFATNVMGTAHVLDAVRTAPTVRAVVVVTTDKCYENREWSYSYREIDRLGGRDPYSSSKACAELATHAWRESFLAEAGVNVATARAGNIVGGGDWGVDRLVPDAVRAFSKNQTLSVRSPRAIRPWQFVLEPLRGYLLVAEACFRDPTAATAWNFGPDDGDPFTVARVCDALVSAWGGSAAWTDASEPSGVHEATNLRLDSSRARRLGWRPTYTVERAIDEAVAWYRPWLSGASHTELSALAETQIERYCTAVECASS